MMLVVIAFCWIGTAIVIAVSLFRIDGVLRTSLTRRTFESRWRADANPSEPEGNVVVYGGFSPFVGSGVDLGGWSFAVDLDRGPPGTAAAKPRPFALAELYDEIGGLFNRLTVPGLSIAQRVFVGGACVRAENRILPDPHRPPLDRLPNSLIKAFSNDINPLVRHYLCIETKDWGGELVITMFTRFRIISNKLFIETNSFLLPPLKDTFYKVDKLHDIRRPKDTISLIARAIAMAPFLLLAAPLLMWARIVNASQKSSAERAEHKTIDDDLQFNYGAQTSLRQAASGSNWHVYFQKLDKEMYQKIMQRQLIDGLVDFLDEHDIDTSEIRERTTHILNNGLIVSGGSISAQGLAVGEGAQAKVGLGAQRARGKVAA